MLDVRDESEFARGLLPGALNIPSLRLHEEYSRLPVDRENVVHCNTVTTSHITSQFLKRYGYRSRYLNAFVRITDNQHTTEP
ncbi:MAG: rhodanese-like domain-containing protein [Syntrophaceae bacterium]|nr:rhodanese-like domain-containing protein [Syntrophaceae bacterium]